jgi:uncharacterized protein YkwD
MSFGPLHPWRFLAIVAMACTLAQCGIPLLDPEGTAPNLNTQLIEIQVHELTNEQRQQAGLTPVGYDPALADIARAHSQDMNDRDFFDHVNPDGKDPAERGNDRDYSCYRDYGHYYTIGISENLFMSDVFNSLTTYYNIPASYDWMTEKEIAQASVQGWMESPGHRENLLTPTHSVEGIGVSWNPVTHKIYITQNFC